MIEVPIENSKEPWLFPTIANFAEVVIRPERNFRAQLDHFGVTSNEINGNGFPDEWRSETGRVGVLLGMETGMPQTFENSDGDVRIVPITILRPCELAAIRTHDDKRNEIVTALAQLPRGHCCRLSRKAVAMALKYQVPAYKSKSQKPTSVAWHNKPWWKPW